MDFQFIFKDMFLKEVEKLGGKMANCHAHLDRAYTVTPELLEEAQALMEEKWIINRKIKKEHTEQSIIERMSFCIEDFIKQGITACRTHVDADSIVEMLVVESAAKVREKYKDRFTLQLVPQPLEGFLNKEGNAHDKSKIELYEKACEICDVVGGLPSRDRKMTNGDKKHADILFSIAKNLGKDMDVHIDQENNPEEKDTSWFLEKIEKNKMQGKVTLIHVISTSCQQKEERERIYKNISDTGTNVTVCPRAAISMKQHKDKMAPVHNSLAQIDEMLKHNINIGIGTDNISDIFLPEVNGNLYEEISMLASACRFYNIEKLAEIATINGQKTMKINK